MAEFWWWALFAAVLVTAAFFLDATLAGIILLIAVLPTAAVASRRLRDTNRSGWWTLLALIPFPGIPILAALLVFEGTRGNNRFGPDPLGRSPRKRMPSMPGDDNKRTADMMAVWQDRQ